MAQGYGYAPEGIITPQASGDMGIPNLRADVAGAGAGMDRIAQAGKELDRAAQNRMLQEDRVAVLERKSQDTIAANQALLEFQGKVTGNLKEDMAAWQAVSSKIGQGGLESFGDSRERAESYRMEFDRLHTATTQKVQELSDKALRLRTKAVQADSLSNVTKAAMSIVEKGGENYPAEVEGQLQTFADLVNADATQTADEKKATLQGARQHMYMEVAKYQAETRPGQFSRDWRDGVWTKHLSPEAVLQLQPFAQTAETTNAVRGLQMKYPNNPAAAVREALSPEYGTARGYTEKQQREVAGYFEGVSNFNYQQQQRGREQAARGGVSMLADAYLAGTPEAFQKIAMNANVDPHTRETAAKAFQSSQNKGNIPLYVDTANKASAGQITAQEIRDLIGPGGLTAVQADKAIKVMDSVSPSDKIAIAVRLRAFDGEVKDPEMRKQFATVFRRTLKANKITGDEEIMRVGDELAKDTGWFSNNAPYLKAYQDMQASGATSLRTRGGGQAADPARAKARELLQSRGANPSEANIQAVMADPEFKAMIGGANGAR